MSAPRSTGCSFSSSGRANFRKPLTTSSSRRISLADDVDVLRDIGAGGMPSPAAGARPVRRRDAAARDRLPRQLLLQQLEVNRHRVERVLHLVRDARHQPAERGELARVVQRRVHLAQVAEVARDEHRAEEPAAGVLDRVASSSSRSARVGVGIESPAPATRAVQRDRDRAQRLASGERLLDELSRMAGCSRRCARRAARSSPGCRRSARRAARTARRRPRGCP